MFHNDPFSANRTSHKPFSCAAVLESIQCPRRAVAFAHADDLNRKRNTADKTAECKPRRYAMLAEIFMLRLEAAARAAKEAANCSRFPISLPTAKAS
jgi:hypothetical protein